MTIYLAGPITGKTSEEVFNHFDDLSSILKDMNFKVIHPMIGKDSLRNEKAFKGQGYASDPVTTDRAIFSRDMWAVEQADILFVDLSEAISKSIGSIMEIAWGSLLRKQIILVMPSDNIHNHAFINQAATIVFQTQKEALEYIEQYKFIDRKNYVSV